MEEEMGTKGATDVRRGPTWRGWVLSILVAVLLSVTATLLLGGSGAFRSDPAIGAGAGHTGAGHTGSRAGSSCCPPAVAGK
jgi:hypothetical protein